MLADAQALPQLVRHGDWDWHLHAVADDAPLATRIAVETAMAMVDVIRADEMSRLGICADDELRRRRPRPVPQPVAPVLQYVVRQPERGRGLPGPQQEHHRLSGTRVRVTRPRGARHVVRTRSSYRAPSPPRPGRRAGCLAGPPDGLGVAGGATARRGRAAVGDEPEHLLRRRRLRPGHGRLLRRDRRLPGGPAQARPDDPKGGADVVGLQEAERNTAALAALLGWHADPACAGDLALPALRPAGGGGLYMFVEPAPGQVVAVANTHLPSTPYGPYWARAESRGRSVLALENRLRVPRWTSCRAAAARRPRASRSSSPVTSTAPRTSTGPRRSPTPGRRALPGRVAGQRPARRARGSSTPTATSTPTRSPTRASPGLPAVRSPARTRYRTGSTGSSPPGPPRPWRAWSSARRGNPHGGRRRSRSVPDGPPRGAVHLRRRTPGGAARGLTVEASGGDRPGQPAARALPRHRWPS